MSYHEIMKCLNQCEQHLNEGGGKITSIVLLNFYFPENIKNLIKKDYKTVRKIVEFYYQDFKIKLACSNNLDEALSKIEFIKFKSSDKKSYIINIATELFLWLKSEDFFINIYENNAPVFINNADIAPINNISEFVPRENQKEAFDRLESKGLETGIHCQATGCGKSFIIIRYCDYANRTITNPKIILFTERVNILSDLFSFAKGKVSADKTKIKYWKNMGIGDLTNFDIINRVTIKKKDWAELLINATKPTLLVINRAFLTVSSIYDKITESSCNLILHDECHNTSSVQCHTFLTKCKQLLIPIVGFSATPLRTGYDDKPKLLEIYSKPTNPEELNLLTNYNIIYAINKELIVPPEFYWYQIESTVTEDNDVEENKETGEILQEDLGAVLELLNHLIPLLPNKKIVAWCGTIALAKAWKSLFESCYRQRINLRHFKFGLDTSECKTVDYDLFSKCPVDESGNILNRSDLNKRDRRLMYWGKSILFCANKHREGSDIKLLDGCIFLDKVKNRGAIPFIQSIGRVLRLCPNTPNKIKGVIIDGIVKETNNYERQFVDKIIGYYMALENLSLIDETNKTKYDQYIEMRDIVQFDKEKEIISMRLGNRDIKIHCNKLEWGKLISKFDGILQEKIGISEDEALLLEFNKLKTKVIKKQFTDKEQYYTYAIKKNLDIEPKIKFERLWTGWYNFLGIDTSIYPSTKKEWKKECDKYLIKKESVYRQNWNIYNLPSMPEELYNNFGQINIELKNKKTPKVKKIDL
jgi:superfamily II DNA or RNA helicase